MSDTTTIKGEIPARIAGVLIIIYGVIIFVSALIAAQSISIGIVLLLACSALAVLVGAGLNCRNYYAWFTAMALTVVSLVGGLIPLLLSYARGVPAEGANYAMKLVWPMIFFCLLFAAKPACPRTEVSAQQICMPVKKHFAILLAVSITLATLLTLKVIGFGAFLVIGFPALVIEGGFLYVLGLNIQKRLGWSD